MGRSGRRNRLLATSLAACAGLALLAAPAPAASAATARVDWRNTSYVLTCSGRAAKPFSVRVRQGEGRARGDRNSPDGYLVSVAEVASGDLTGDGRAETAVLVYCSPWSNHFTPEVVVFTSGRRLLGRLPKLPAPTGGLASLYLEGRFAISGGRLVTGVGYYARLECRACGPTLADTLVWRWNGRRFVARFPVGSGSRSAPRLW